MYPFTRGDSDPVNPNALFNALQKAEVTIYYNSVGENTYGDSWPKGAFPAGNTNVSTCAVGHVHIGTRYTCIIILMWQLMTRKIMVLHSDWLISYSRESVLREIFK